MEAKTERMKVFFHLHQDDIVAFVTGGIFSAIFSAQFVEKLLTAMIVGFFGGIVGMMGKETYSWIKSKIFKNDK
jgi:hypothetical protein